MKRFIRLASVLAATTLPLGAYAGGPEIRECQFEVKARCASGDAHVTLTDGVVTKLEVSVEFCGLRGKPGYSCSIDSSRANQDVKWSQGGATTIIDNSSPFNPTQPDRVKVTLGKFISIDMDEAQPLGRCGAGAELPRAIVIRPQEKACSVWLRTP